MDFKKRPDEAPQAPSEGPPPLQAAQAGRKEAEAGLRQSEEQFAQLVSGVRDYAVFLLDRHGNIRTWNAGAEQIKGYRAEEIIGEHFSKFYPKESVASGWPEYELKMAAATGRFEDEGWRLRKDGSRFWTNVVITALRDQTGEVRGYLKITRDLTERKNAEEKLRLSEERFRLMVDGVRDYAIFMLDPQGYVATWNSGAQRIKGYTAEEIIGEHFSRFYPPEAIAKDWPATELRHAIADGRFEDEGWRVRKDGMRFWANVVITAVKDETGALRGFVKVTRDLTERKQAEDKERKLLQEEAARKAAESSAAEARRAQGEEQRQREQLRVTLSSIGDAVIVTDEAGAVTFLNPVAVRLTGWQLEEATGQPLGQVFRIINEETRLVVENPVDRVLRERRVVGLANHTILVAKDGREVPVEDSAAPIQTEDGRILGVVLVFRDVTEARRAMQDRLHLAAIVESSEDAIISKNLDGTIVSWNKGAERLYGYTAEEIVGRPLSRLVPPDQPDELPGILKRIRSGERIEHLETTRLRKDGTPVLVSLTVSPVKDAEGRIVGASKIARDITATKRHEAALRFLAEASKLMGEMLELPATLQRLAALAVPSFADWCAADAVEPDGSLRRVALVHQDRQKVELAWAESRRAPPKITDLRGAGHVLSTGRSEMVQRIDDEELLVTARDEDHLRFLSRLGLRSYICVPVVSRGQIVAVLSFSTAESRQRYEEDSLRVAEDLAQRIGVAVENANLYRALREEDRRKSEFLAVLAHELRNPLAPLRNGLEVLRLTGTDPEALTQVRDMMERQVLHMSRLVDDLLDVSRISRGKIVLRKERLALSEVVASAVEASMPLVQRQRHELTVEQPEEPLYLDGDKTRLAQAVGNLLSNAVKYSDPGSRIRLTVQRAGGQAVLRVRDTGIGIPASMLTRVFEMFTQVDRALEKSQGGLGVGLTIVKQLVELHGGSVEVHSEGEGKGSEFVVRLPLVASTGRESEAQAAADLPAAPGARHRILVVDDNADAASSLALMLQLMGNEVRTSNDGVEGVETAAAFRPELILLDIGMPRLNGYETCRRIREQPWGKNVFIVALTGWGQAEDKRRSQEAGFDRHLVKPIEPAALENLMGLLPPGTSAPRPAAASPPS